MAIACTCAEDNARDQLTFNLRLVVFYKLHFHTIGILQDTVITELTFYLRA